MGKEPTAANKETKKRKPAKKRAAARKKKEKSKAALVKKLIDQIEDRIDTNEVKASVGDLIRLIQLGKELEAEQPKEIKVQWVDATAEPASET